jgi:hypothetical protein
MKYLVVTAKHHDGFARTTPRSAATTSSIGRRWAPGCAATARASTAPVPVRWDSSRGDAAQ